MFWIWTVSASTPTWISRKRKRRLSELQLSTWWTAHGSTWGICSPRLALTLPSSALHIKELWQLKSHLWSTYYNACDLPASAELRAEPWITRRTFHEAVYSLLIQKGASASDLRESKWPKDTFRIPLAPRNNRVRARDKWIWTARECGLHKASASCCWSKTVHLSGLYLWFIFGVSCYCWKPNYQSHLADYLQGRFRRHAQLLKNLNKYIFRMSSVSRRSLRPMASLLLLSLLLL